MKVILLEDIKNKGKKDDVVDLASGYAMHLIRENKAVDANKKTISDLKSQQAIKQEENIQLEKQAIKDKEVLDNNELVFTLKTGSEGKVFKSVSHKQIIDYVKEKYNIKLDKRKFKSNENINNLGTTKIDVELYKGVITTLKVVIKGE